MFEITSGDIKRLDEKQLVKLLRRLLYTEAKLHKIKSSEIHVPLNINSPDGGEDGRITVNKASDYLMKGTNIFQVKATNMTPKSCKDELINKRGELKSQIDKMLNDGGNYILFCNYEFSQQAIDQRLKKFEEAIVNCKGESYLERIKIKIYDANKISEWANKHFNVIVSVYEYLEKGLPISVKTIDEWTNYVIRKFNNYYIPHQFNKKLFDEILGDENNKFIFRIYGESGCGKTRFLFEQMKSCQESKLNIHRLTLQQSAVYIDRRDTFYLEYIEE